MNTTISENSIKPVLKYPGAKWKLAPWILSYIPKHKFYLEPYFGSGAVFFNKDKATIETLNDIDGAIVQFFRTCREHPEELAYQISMTPWAREEYQDCDFLDDAPPEDDIERARQFAVRCWMTFGARTRCKTGWRHTTGCNKFNHGPDNPRLWKRMPEIILQVADRLLDAQISNRPAIEVIRDYNGPETLIYADPPYLRSTRTLNGDQYRNEMSEQEHKDMLEALLNHNGMVVLSAYKNDIYEKMLAGWSTAYKRAVAERGAKRTEYLYINPICARRLQISSKQTQMNIFEKEVMCNG